MKNKELYFTYFFAYSSFQFEYMSCYRVTTLSFFDSLTIVLKKRSKTEQLSKSNEMRFLLLFLHQNQSILKGEHLTINACM